MGQAAVEVLADMLGRRPGRSQTEGHQRSVASSLLVDRDDQ